MAIPLTQYLDPRASYEGFDIVPDGIKWCQEQITSRYPNFRFQLASVKNNVYQPDGKVDAFNYEFPYEDGSFDFVFLTSVFTHMRPRDMKNYLSEICRVLKTGRNCFSTYFLISEKSPALMDAGESSWKFIVDSSGYYAIDPKNPEAAVAYEESYIRDCYKDSRLRIMHPIHYGFWCGRSQDKCLDCLDIIIAKKADSFAQ